MTITNRPVVTSELQMLAIIWEGEYNEGLASALIEALAAEKARVDDLQESALALIEQRNRAEARVKELEGMLQNWRESENEPDDELCAAHDAYLAHRTGGAK